MIGYVIAFLLGAIVGSPVLYYVVCRIIVDGMPWNWTRKR